MSLHVFKSTITKDNVLGSRTLVTSGMSRIRLTWKYCTYFSTLSLALSSRSFWMVFHAVIVLFEDPETRTGGAASVPESSDVPIRLTGEALWSLSCDFFVWNGKYDCHDVVHGHWLQLKGGWFCGMNSHFFYKLTGLRFTLYNCGHNSGEESGLLKTSSSQMYFYVIYEYIMYKYEINR